MALIGKVDLNGLDAKLNAYFFKKVLNKHIALFQRTGEEFVNDCKDNHHGRWENRTGNLESSIGYVIYYNGQVVSKAFDGNAEGTTEAEKTAKKAAGKSGLVLIGVAGMQYAAALEAKGYNVITTEAKWHAFNLSDRIKKLKIAE